MPVLTTKQREVLNGEFEGSDNAERIHRHRIEERSQKALEELIEVAESDEHDNSEVFPPEVIRELLQAIMGDPYDIEPRWERDSMDYETYQYEMLLVEALGSLHTQYGDRLFRRDPPENHGGGLVDE